MKLYIAVLDEVPNPMVPVLVAHAILGAHLRFYKDSATYDAWLTLSFRKVVIKVNRKEFHKILLMDDVFTAHENTVLNAEKSCAVVCPREDYPNVIKFAKLWQPTLPA